MRNVCLVSFFLVFFTACGPSSFYTPVPKGFNGPSALIVDSMSNGSRNSADFFVVKTVDSQRIWNSMNASIKTGAYAGYIDASIIKRSLPIKKMKLLISGSNISAAPIFGLFNSKMSIYKEIDFLPIEGEQYKVAGVLTSHYASIWIENNFGIIVTAPIELFKDEKNISENEKVTTRQLAKLDSTTQNSNLQEVSKVEYFMRLKYGVEVDEFLKLLGTAQSIKHNKRTFFNQNPETYDYIYNGLGVIRTTAGRDEDIIVKVIPKLDVSKFNVVDIKMHLNEYDKNLRHLFIRQYWLSGVSDIKLLDVMAEKIWNQRNTKDNKIADSMAWLCRVIEKSSNNRYQDFFSNLLSDNTVNKKIEKFAKKALKKIKQGNKTQQFILK